MLQTKPSDVLDLSRPTWIVSISLLSRRSFGAMTPFSIPQCLCLFSAGSPMVLRNLVTLFIREKQRVLVKSHEPFNCNGNH